MRDLDGDLRYVGRWRGEFGPQIHARSRLHVGDFVAANALAFGVSHDEILFLVDRVDEVNAADALVIALALSIAELVAPHVEFLAAVIAQHEFERDGVATHSLELSHVDVRTSRFSVRGGHCPSRRCN